MDERLKKALEIPCPKCESPLEPAEYCPGKLACSNCEFSIMLIAPMEPGESIRYKEIF